MRITSVVALFADLPETELASWVTRGWVLPDLGDADRGVADRVEAAQGEAAQGEAARGEAARGEAARGEAARGEAAQGEAGWNFREIDVARVRLIHDLQRVMAIDEATMPLVLSLLDQVYALRGTLRDLLRALETQPEPVRTTVFAALRRG